MGDGSVGFVATVETGCAGFLVYEDRDFGTLDPASIRLYVILRLPRGRERGLDFRGFAITGTWIGIASIIIATAWLEGTSFFHVILSFAGFILTIWISAQRPEQDRRTHDFEKVLSEIHDIKEALKSLDKKLDERKKAI